jgi:hypothetical protein
MRLTPNQYRLLAEAWPELRAGAVDWREADGLRIRRVTDREEWYYQIESIEEKP